jgi:hypothetical protein
MPELDRAGLWKELREVYDRRAGSQPCGNCRMNDVYRHLLGRYAPEEADALYREFSTAVLGFVA